MIECIALSLLKFLGIKPKLLSINLYIFLLI